MTGRITRSVTIASGAALSGTLDCEGYTVAGIIMPSGWTAANLTFRGSQADEPAPTTLTDLYAKDGTEYTVTAAASRYHVLGADLAGVRFLQFRSGTSAVPVNQAAQRIIIVILVSQP